MHDAQANPVGVGLRPVHYPHLLGSGSTGCVRWFEAISENYMDTAGRPLAVLERIRRDFPVALHGVSLSIGYRPPPGDHAAEARFRETREAYLSRLAALASRVDPMLLSDHLCWTGVPGSNLHDLLPTPFTEESLAWIVEQVGRAQEVLGRPLVLENVSSYFTWERSTWTEQDFLVEVARRSGCRVLLDVNNVFVSARNHGFDAAAWLDAVPSEVVAQVHLAGHTDLGTHLFDTHSRPVCDEVWDLFAHVVARLPGVPVLVEWDEDIPSFDRLEQEAARAQEVAVAARAAVVRREYGDDAAESCGARAAGRGADAA